MRRTVLALAVAMVMVVFFQERAHAVKIDTKKAFRHYRKAVQLYRAKKYVEAAEEYLNAYTYGRDATMYYDAGRSYDKANKSDLAVKYYELFLARRRWAKNRKQVQARVKELKAAIAAAGTSPSGEGAPAARPEGGPKTPEARPDKGKKTGPAQARPGETTPGTPPAAAPGRPEGARPTPPKPAEPASAGPGEARPKTRPAVPAARPEARKDVKAPEPKERKDLKVKEAAEKVEEEKDKEKKPVPASKLEMAAWAMVGATAILLTVTGVFALKVEDAEDQMSRLSRSVDPLDNLRLPYTGSYKKDYEKYKKDGELYEKLTWTFAGLSAAAGLTAAALFTVDHFMRKKNRKEKPASGGRAVRVTPQIFGQGAAMGVSWDF